MRKTGVTNGLLVAKEQDQGLQDDPKSSGDTYVATPPSPQTGFSGTCYLAHTRDGEREAGRISHLQMTENYGKGQVVACTLMSLDTNNRRLQRLPTVFQALDEGKPECLFSGRLPTRSILQGPENPDPKGTFSFTLCVFADFTTQPNENVKSPMKGRCGFNSQSGKIPHVEQLSPCTTTTAPVLWNLALRPLKPQRPRAHAPRQGKPLPSEACAQQPESSPPRRSRRKAHAAVKTQHSLKQ
ncbi:hypothetical protein MJG53_002944 [Ovis ammon polii x Ovis aries]|uniref:Uncharacterized protein n=1 Tax=Ovis ammon polii x Ovis aries TaxID=2918886 RepID=A0ACB9VFM3_9CETA|nr:hypothetical protein MJT46_004292 [Ovis ammon polii x Ovis aries]KAI4588536.1 hypothetical protein MJG53_002944 [Ovis ammon polii x Ovis aries]